MGKRENYAYRVSISISAFNRRRSAEEVEKALASARPQLLPHRTSSHHIKFAPRPPAAALFHRKDIGSGDRQ